jgi:hypothetical protein
MMCPDCKVVYVSHFPRKVEGADRLWKLLYNVVFIYLLFMTSPNHFKYTGIKYINSWDFKYTINAIGHSVKYIYRITVAMRKYSS